MTTNIDISQDISTNYHFSAINISYVVKSTGTVSVTEDNFPLLSYRKSYVAWDSLERANKPE